MYLYAMYMIVHCADGLVGHWINSYCIAKDIYVPDS
jgi:hypothetical protein